MIGMILIRINFCSNKSQKISCTLETFRVQFSSAITLFEGTRKQCFEMSFKVIFRKSFWKAVSDQFELRISHFYRCGCFLCKSMFVVIDHIQNFGLHRCKLIIDNFLLFWQFFEQRNFCGIDFFVPRCCERFEVWLSFWFRSFTWNGYLTGWIGNFWSRNSGRVWKLIVIYTR